MINAQLLLRLATVTTDRASCRKMKWRRCRNPQVEPATLDKFPCGVRNNRPLRYIEGGRIISLFLDGQYVGVSGNALIPKFESDLCEAGAAGLPRDGRKPSFPRVAMSNSREKGSS